VVDRVEWLTSEYYYQVHKFPVAPVWMEAIHSNPCPYNAWQMGWSPDHPRRAD
jgi:hypothetical protein